MTGFALRSPWYARERAHAGLFDAPSTRPVIQMYDGTDFVDRIVADPTDLGATPAAPVHPHSWVAVVVGDLSNCTSDLLRTPLTLVLIQIAGVAQHHESFTRPACAIQDLNTQLAAQGRAQCASS